MRKRRELPPPNRVPENTTGMAFFDIESVSFGSWGPFADGKGPQTQVHLIIRLKAGGPPMIMRFKSAVAVDLFIAAMRRHRNDVWPGHTGDDEEATP